MRISAVIFDLYKTLLDVQPGSDQPQQGWVNLYDAFFNAPPPLDFLTFQRQTDEAVRRENDAARLAGVPFPEVYWPEIAQAVLPALSSLSSAHLDDFLFRHAQIQRTVQLALGAKEVLQFLMARSIPMGIASNSQPYTLREMDQVLANAELNRAMFDSNVCFFSFQAGFSKPDPHVFRWISSRLRARRIPPGAILMVGDRVDNDVTPATLQGWQTWQYSPEATVGTTNTGNFTALLQWLQSR